MTKFTWTGASGAAWTTSASWSPSGIPGTSAADTAVVNVGGVNLFGTAETIAALTIGAAGSVGIDNLSSQTGGSLTVTGTLSNSGGPKNTGGFFVGNSSVSTTGLSVGTFVNATANSLADIQNATVTITGNVTNAGKGVNGAAGLGIGYFGTGEVDANVSVGGGVTNSGLFGLGDGSTLVINGTLTNSGASTANGGVFLGKSTSSTSSATIGSIVNGAGAALDISNAAVSVTGNVTNSSTGNIATNGFGVAFLSSNSDVSGTLTVAGTFTNKGNFGVGNTGITSDVTASMLALTNSSPGQILVTGGTTSNVASLNVTGAGTVTNSGIIDIEHNGDMTIGTLTTVGNLTNSGTVRLDLSNPLALTGSELSISGTLTNTATALGAGIAVDGSSTLFATNINNSGSLFGTGTIFGDIDNTGKVFGGSLNSSNVVTPGTLLVEGSYTQESKGSLIEQITSNGGHASEIAVDGTATLAGALTVNSSGGLGILDSFTVLSTDGYSGTFSSIDGVAGQVVTNIGGGLGYVISYGLTEVTLDVVTAGATDTWIGTAGVAANWTTGADWNARTPGATDSSTFDYSADSAVINAGGIVDVTSNVRSIANLTLGPKSGTVNPGSLLMNAGTLVVSDNVTNNGALGVDSGAGDKGSTFTDYGTFTNNSNAAANGGLQIGNNTGDVGTTTATFGNIVNGASGSIGIDDAKVLVTGNVTNSGNVPGTDGIGVGFGSSSPGGLLQVDGTLTNKGAFAVGNNGGDLTLADVQVASLVNSGTLSIVGSNSDSTVFSNFQASTGSNSGKINVSDGGTLELGPSFSNSGSINLTGSTENAELAVNDGGLTLNGGGKVVLTTDAVIATAADATLGFTIDAGTPADGDVIDLTFKNSGLTGLTGSGVTVHFDISSTDTSGDIAAGLAAAINANHTLSTDGIVASSLDGLLAIREAGSVGNSTTVDPVFTTHNGTETIDPSSTTALGSDGINTGGNPTFTNVNNTISGSGTIGDQFMTLDNESVIDGDVANADLIVSTGGSGGNTITNSGTLEATGTTGGLEIGSDVTNTTKGVVFASGTGAHVDLEGILVTGGTFKTASGGVIFADDDTTINGVTNTGSLTVADGATLELEGATFTNSGNLSITTDGASGALEIGSDIGLAGKGTITLVAGSTDANGVIEGDSSPVVLTNISNTIVGAGTIGGADLTLVNEGTINGNSSSFGLFLNTGSNVIINLGTLEGSGAGSDNGLVIESNVINTKLIEALGAGATVAIDSTVSNTLGTVLASGTGAVVDLESGTINGGTLQTTGTSAAIVSLSGTNALNNVTIAAKSVIEDGGGALTITGGSAGAGATVQIDNGSIELASASSLNASFINGGVGSLILDQVGTAPNLSYTGSITGFGGAFHSDTTQSIDLKNVAYDGSVDTIGSYVANASNTGGVLTIDDNGTAVAQLTFVGQYTTANFTLAVDSGTGTKITDPGSSGLADIGLLNNYVAASGGSQSSTTSTPTHIASTQQLDLASSHHAA